MTNPVIAILKHKDVSPMSTFSVYYDPKKRLILADHRGVFTPEKGNQLIQRVIELAQKHDVSRVLIDNRKLIVRLSTTETFERGKFLTSSELLFLVSRIALIYPAEMDELPFQFDLYEAVTQNRGLNVRFFFGEKKKAVEWLTEGMKTKKPAAVSNSSARR